MSEEPFDAQDEIARILKHVEVLHALIVADGLLLELFMRKVAEDSAVRDPEPTAWARAFAEKLTSDVDAIDQKFRSEPTGLAAYQHARDKIDRLAQHLALVLGRPR